MRPTPEDNYYIDRVAGSYVVRPDNPTFLRELARKVTQVQAQMEESALLTAVIDVLRGKGYTVIEPKTFDRWIDPPSCGCTDCLTGFSRPAVDDDEYLQAERVGEVAVIFVWLCRLAGWLLGFFRPPPPRFNRATYWSQCRVDIDFDNIAMRNRDLDEVE